MMKKQRILMLLTFVVVFLMSIPAYAAETANVSGSNPAASLTMSDGTTTEYATLRAAVAAAPTDGTVATITLLRDEEANTGYDPISGSNGSIVIKNKQNVILDLNQKTLSNTQTSTILQVGEDGVLTIKNGTIDAQDASVCVKNKGTLTIESDVTMNNQNKADAGDKPVIKNQGGIVTIEGGTFTGGKCALYNSHGGQMTIKEGTTVSSTEYAIVNESSYTDTPSIVTIEGGSFTGSANAVSNEVYGTPEQAAQIIIEGGSFTGSENGVYNQGNLTIKDGTFTGQTNGIHNEGTVTIEDGSFTGKDADGVYNETGSTAIISGGNYSSLDEEYCSEGYELVQNADGTYTVAVKTGFYQVEDYKGDLDKTEWKTPTADGKVFAGWYTDEKCNTVYKKTTGLAYAKFVDADVLKVKYQMMEATTADSESTDIRLITTIDSVDYKKVGFQYTIGSGEEAVTSSTVAYKSLGAVSGTTYKPSDFSANSKYFIIYTLIDIPNSEFDKDIQVTPYWVTEDGTTVYGALRMFKIQDTI